MKILLTGGAGYVGSVAARDLLKHGHEVRVVDSLLYGGRSLLGLYAEEKFDFRYGDIRSASFVRQALEGMDAVVHLAALVGDPACSRRHQTALEVNQEASIQLLEFSRQMGIRRFIFASTCSNYGRMSDSSEYLTEESELKPVSFYAQTKVAVEKEALQGSAHHEMCATVLRFATVFGLSPRMRFDLTVNEFTMELFTKRKVTIYGEQFWRPYVHVRDAANAVRLALDAPTGKVHRQAFNVGDTKQNYQKGQLVELIRSLLGNHAQIERVTQSEDPRDYRVSFDKIHRELGFAISRPVEAGVREIVEVLSHGIVTDPESSLYRNS